MIEIRPIAVYIIYKRSIGIAFTYNNSINDMLMWQRNRDAIEKWCTDNQIWLTVKRCHHMTSTRKNVPIVTFTENWNNEISWSNIRCAFIVQQSYWTHLLICHQNVGSLTYRINGIYPARSVDYSELLVLGRVQSLQHRWQLNSATFLHRIIRNHVECPGIWSELQFDVSQSSRAVQFFTYNTFRTNLMLHPSIHSYDAKC